MALTIRGEFTATGQILVTSTQKAQAATRGNLERKRVAGVGVLKKHLGEAWEKATPLSLDVVTARACLSTADLQEAGRLFEEVATAEKRKAILEELLTPYFIGTPTLFGQPLGEVTAAAREIDAAKLTEALEPRLPEQELIMVASGTAEERTLISRDQVTCEQYAIFREQTEHRAPYYKDQSDAAVVGVDYRNDAVGFTEWQGRRMPTGKEFLAAKRAGILQADKLWEWVDETTEEGWQVCRSVRGEFRYSNDPDSRGVGSLAFRVAEG